jgi:beta-glucosidase
MAQSWPKFTKRRDRKGKPYMIALRAALTAAAARLRHALQPASTLVFVSALGLALSSLWFAPESALSQAHEAAAQEKQPAQTEKAAAEPKASATTAQPAEKPSDRPWMNAALEPQKRAELLVKAMTLDEKLLQIHMMDVRGEHPREVKAIERLGIPAFKITNGPLGAGPGDTRDPLPATALPSPLALASSWDPELAETFGRVAGREVGQRGDHLLEAPGLNIVRVPQNGRNFEYFSEDPYLTARLAVPEILGIQSQGIIAEAKHYAANNQEADRKTVNEIVDERTLREIYLPAFEAAVKQGHTAAIMCAYPSVNGQFGCENTHLLKDILRDEWGFKGFVQSDYTATHTTVGAALAGLDLAMKHDVWSDEAMKALVAKGDLSENVIDTMLIRRYSQMFQLGWFDHPPAAEPIAAKQDGEIARSIAEQGAVLLKNGGKPSALLPLDPRTLRSIAVIGPYAGAAHTGGSGSSRVTPLYTVTPVEGIKNIVSKDVAVTYNDGIDTAAAAALAKSSDVALVMVGNRDGEGRDRPNLELPENQSQLISAIAAANPRTVVILKTGGPVLMPWLDTVPAVVEAWYPGEEDGNAVADLLFGKVNFSGKLPMTFPKKEGDAPAHTPQQYPGVNGTAAYSEGLKVGYRWYDAEKVEPLFAFGYGLSYTTFAFSKLSLPGLTASPMRAQPNAQANVSFDVTNIGSRAGSDVAQVYVTFPAAAGEPPKQLKGFAKVTLQPGQTQHVTVTLYERAFTIWDSAGKQWTVVPGQYSILVGDSSRSLPLDGKISISALEAQDMAKYPGILAEVVSPEAGKVPGAPFTELLNPRPDAAAPHRP